MESLCFILPVFRLVAVGRNGVGRFEIVDSGVGIGKRNRCLPVALSHAENATGRLSGPLHDSNVKRNRKTLYDCFRFLRERAIAYSLRAIPI